MPLEVFRVLIDFGWLIPSELQGKVRMRIGNSGNRVLIGPSLPIDEEIVYVSELIRFDGHLPRNLWCIVFVNKEQVLISRVIRFFRRLELGRKNMYLYRKKGVYSLTVR